MDDRFDHQLRAAARDYHEPPETPREIMWARIVAAKEKTEKTEKTERAEWKARHLLRLRSLRPLRPLRHLSYAAGIAAVLALGIGLGRWTADQPGSATGTAAAGAEAPQTNTTAYHLAATEHLGQSEAFLTLFRASVRGRGDEQLASATARQLLATNRLLLDSPAARDARTRLLLQDLELVLAEIAQLSLSPRSRDLDLITEGLEEGGVLSRLRTAVPAGTSVSQGAL
jgi:hypothetical protein